MTSKNIGKPLEELTGEEYFQLKATGLLYEIFPQATGVFGDDCGSSFLDMSEGLSIKEALQKVGHLELDLDEGLELGGEIVEGDTSSHFDMLLDALQKTEVKLEDYPEEVADVINHMRDMAGALGTALGLLEVVDNHSTGICLSWILQRDEFVKETDKLMSGGVE